MLYYVGRLRVGIVLPAKSLIQKTRYCIGNGLCVLSIILIKNLYFQNTRNVRTYSISSQPL